MIYAITVALLTFGAGYVGMLLGPAMVIVSAIAVMGGFILNEIQKR